MSDGALLGLAGLEGCPSQPALTPNGLLAATVAAMLLSALLAQCSPVSPPQVMEELGIPVRFIYVDPAASSVCVAGSFNGWSGQSDCMSREGNAWTVALMLSPGRHEYAFVVDGSSWRPDPEAFLSEDSGFGRLNSVLIVE